MQRRLTWARQELRAASERRGEKLCLVFCQSICTCAFSLFFVQLSLSDRARCSLCNWQSKVLWASWRHLNVFAVTGSMAFWWDSEFGVTLDWLFLIKNEISGIWVQANHQRKGPTWFYKPWSWQWAVFERNTLGQPELVEILKGGMCEKEKRKN